MSQQESPLVIKAAGQEDGQDTARTPASSDALSQGMTGTVGAAASPAVMPALEAGTAYTPDQLVQARNASSILGRPEPLVRDSLQESMLEVQARRIAENKTFAGWVSQSAKNATIAKDDIEGLKPVFDSLDMIRQRRDIEEKARRHGGISAYEPGALETIKRLWNEGLFSVGEGMMGTSLLGADAVERNAKEWGLDDLAASAAAYGKSQRQRYQELLNKQPMPLQFDEGSLKEWGADFVRTVPQVGMQVSLAATTGPLSSMAFMGSQIAGNQYLDLVEHQKVDPSRAMWASLANAGMQMPLEYLGMDKLLAIGKVSGLGNVVRTAAVGALSEGATEWLQKYPEAATEIWALAAKEGRGLGDNVQMFMDRFGKITREGMYEGSLALPFGLIGGGGRIAATYRAERYAAQQAGLQSQVEATKLRQMSPDMMQEMLEQNGVTGMEYIQGQTALELFQTDPAVYAEAFGLTQAQLMEAAAMGQDIEVSSARLMTKLDKERYAKVAEVMREAPGSMNLAEARSEAKLSEDTMRVLERWQEQQQELSALAEERKRLREDAIRAVKEIDGLRTEAARMEGGVDAFVDTWLQPYERFAMRMASSGGRNMAETFRTLTFNALRQAKSNARQEGRRLYQRVLQSISSADTSIRQVASSLKKIPWKQGSTNVDIGGGRFDEGTKYLADKGVENLVFDPFNRDEQHNRAVVERLKSGGVDTATATNVLNVIQEKEVRAEVVRQAAKAISQDGTAYFQIYEGDASGQGKQTSKGWQNNAKTAAYLEEVGQYFGDVRRKGNLIEARAPRPGEGQAVWMLEGTDGPTELFQSAPPVDSSAFKKWFGDSKVVDKNGDPLVVYHGTGTTIEAFDPSFTGQGNDQIGSGFYFTSNEDTAKGYETATLPFSNREKPGGADTPNTISAYLSIENPILLGSEQNDLQDVPVSRKQAEKIILEAPDIFDADESPLTNWIDNGGKQYAKRHVSEVAENYKDNFIALENDFFGGDATAFRQAVNKTMGYDGVIKEFANGEKHFVAWFPTQVKSVDNRGTFDPSDPRILYQQDGGASLDAIVQEAKDQGIDLVASDKNGIITVHKIVVPEGQRGNGAGTDMMRKIIDRAESNGQVIALTPSADFGGSKARLNSWYKQLGFMENKGRNKIFSTQEALVRRPQNPSQVFYQPGSARGSLEIRPEGYLIDLFRQADLSTMLHETGHIFLEEIERAIQLGSADEALVRDYDALKKWLARFETEAALKEEYNRSVKSTPAFQGRKFEELNDTEKADARRIAEKEYFARGFEAYLMEGKAPAPELMGAFERFKAWLLNVYEAAKRDLGVELNDEVRGVFDRLLATEEEIEQVAASNELFALTQKELDALGVKGPERNYQASLMEAAKRRAVEKLQLARDRDRRSRLSQWAKEARAEILQDPVYAARSELYTKDGFLDADAIAARHGDDALKSLRKSVGAFGVKPGGQDPEIFAAKHGFTDGAEMLSAITQAESMGKRVREIVAAKEAARDASIDPAPYLLETREAARQAELVGQYLSRNLGREALQQQAFERVAQEKLSAMPMGKARLTNQFTAAMRRALRQERIAIGKGDFEAALEANTQARLNLEFSRQARTIGEMQEATERAAKRFVGMTKADPSARYAVNDIAARYGLMKYDQRLIDGKDENTISRWLAARKEDGFTVFIRESVLKDQRSWRDISVAEFENVAEAISQIVAVERNSRKLMTAANKESFESAVDEAVQETFTYRQAKPIKTIEEESFITQGLAFVHAAHTKIETLCVALDGGKPLGANWNLIYKPINDADNRRGLMFKELGERLKGPELFGAYTAEELSDMARKKTFEPAVGESLTKGQRLMAALNMGNEGNYTRLLAGRNWTQEQAATVTESLDARDWKFVQGIWDTFEVYKGEAFALQEEVSGQRPSSVEARPLKTKSGELRGGYFPVIYDRRHAKVDLQEKLITNDNPAFAMTRHGHLQERNSQGAGTPLDLSMSVIPAKLQDVITDLCYRRAYIDVGRVLRNKAYRHSIESTVGHEQYQAMIAWLKDSAKESKSKSDGENMAQWARSSATMMAMGYKFTTMLAQPFGITQSIEALGYTYTMQGINMAYGKGVRATMETAKWVKEVSPMMAQRIKSFDRDVADATANFSRQSLTPDNLMSSLTSKAGLRKAEQWFKEHAFVPMGVVQFGVDLPTWCGAYQKGLKDFDGSETKARDYADSVVRLTQGSGAAKDLARVQRGSQYAKLFTMFYTYFNTLYNMTALRVADVNMNRDMASVTRAGNSFLLLYMIPAVLTEIVAGRGPDDDEEFLAWSAKQLLMYPMQTIVGMRSIAGAIEGEFGYKASPAEAAPEAVYKFIVEVNKALTDDNYKFDGKKAAKLGLKTLGYVAGLPLGQAEISAFNVWDYLDGTSGDYELRDLIFRRQKSRR